MHDYFWLSTKLNVITWKIDCLSALRRPLHKIRRWDQNARQFLYSFSETYTQQCRPSPHPLLTPSVVPRVIAKEETILKREICLVSCVLRCLFMVLGIGFKRNWILQTAGKRLKIREWNSTLKVKPQQLIQDRLNLLPLVNVLRQPIMKHLWLVVQIFVDFSSSSHQAWLNTQPPSISTVLECSWTLRRLETRSAAWPRWLQN